MAEMMPPTAEAFRVFQIAVPVGEMPYDAPDRQRAKLAVSRLSPREREILPLLAARWTDREIGEALYISHRTVTTHVSNIYSKLGINSRREVVPFLLVAEDTAA